MCSYYYILPLKMSSLSKQKKWQKAWGFPTSLSELQVKQSVMWNESTSASRDWNLHVVGVRWKLDVGWSMQVSILMLVSVLDRYWSDYWEVKNIANWIVKNSLWHTALPYVTCLNRIKVSVLVSAVLDLYLLGIRLLVEHIALHLDFPLWVMYMS